MKLTFSTIALSQNFEPAKTLSRERSCMKVITTKNESDEYGGRHPGRIRSTLPTSVAL
jgi:hypothetical protein